MISENVPPMAIARIWVLLIIQKLCYYYYDYVVF